MLLGIMSDSHNNVHHIQKALSIFRSRDITTIFHAGDVTDPEVLKFFGGFNLFLSFGNGDLDLTSMQKTIKQLNTESEFGYSVEASIQKHQFFMIHGDNREKLEKAINSGKYDFVITGHTHRYRDEIIGSTRVINPGAMGGVWRSERSVVVMDLNSYTVEKLLLV